MRQDLHGDDQCAEVPEVEECCRLRVACGLSPKTAYVSLIADHHSPTLYSKFGFKPTAPVSIGMAFKV